MKIISVINYKGGVGKTTVTSNLASEMARRGKRVLAIDLDPQTNLTFSYMKVEQWKEQYEKDRTIKYWFDSIIDSELESEDSQLSFKDLIVNKDIDLICSHLGLVDIDIELAAGLTGNTERQRKSNYIKTYSYIKNEIRKIKNDYDVVLFDCPPNFSIVTKNAIIASDYYLIPAKMDYLSTLGINQLRKHVDSLVKEYNDCCVGTQRPNAHPKFLGVVATMVSVRNGDPITAQKNYISQLKRNGVTVFENMIRENKTLYADAPNEGRPVVLQRGLGATYSRVVKEWRALTDEFLERAEIE